METKQLTFYKEKGYMLIPKVFNKRELAILKSEVSLFKNIESPAKILEKNRKSIRTIYGVHQLSYAFDQLARNSLLIKVAQTILGKDIYIYQSKINIKQAFIGSKYHWHQDYAFWHKRDGLSSPNAINAVVFLDSVKKYNAPIEILEASHQENLIETENFCISDSRMKALKNKYKTKRIIGDSGSVLFFGSNLIHGSSRNYSPFNRCLAFITYCSIDNKLEIGRVQRSQPEYLASRNYQPIIS